MNDNKIDWINPNINNENEKIILYYSCIDDIF